MDPALAGTMDVGPSPILEKPGRPLKQNVARRPQSPEIRYIGRSMSR
jgi:hypothetical protein